MTDTAQQATTQEVQPQAQEALNDASANVASTTQEVVATPEQPTPDVNILLREREEAKREAQNLRKQLRAKEQAEEETARAAMSETDRLKAEVESLRQQQQTWSEERRSIVSESTARDVAERLSIIDYRDALALVEKSSIVYGDDGKPENLETLFLNLIKAKPYLVSGEGRSVKPSTTTNAASGTSGGPTVRLTSEELEAAERAGMSPERYSALKQVKTLDDWKKSQNLK
jgi:hypothetical protein